MLALAECTVAGCIGHILVQCAYTYWYNLSRMRLQGVSTVPAHVGADSPVGPETTQGPDQGSSNGGNRGVGPITES